MAFECPAKGSFRAVAESMSGFPCAHALLTKPTPGEGHSPPGPVLHGWHAHKPREALSKDGAGQVDLPGEGDNGPGFFGAAMDQDKRTPDVGITQRPKPAGPPVLVALQPRANSLRHSNAL